MSGIDERWRRRLSRPSPQAGIVAVLAFAGLCSSFMFTLVVPIQSALPQLLNASREDTAWVLTATLLASAVITPVAGRLGDMYGKRRIVLMMLAVTAVGGVIAAIAPGIVWVIIGRVLQGAMSGVVPLGIAIMRDVLHESRVDGAIALMSATLGVGGALGLPASALLTEYTDWHVLFAVAAGLAVLCFGLVLWVVPVSVLRTAGRFDYLGAAGLTLGLTGILLAISRGDVWGWLSPLTLGCGLGGAVVLVLWGWYQLGTPDPLLDLRIAARRPVLLTNLASVALGFGLFSSNVVYPQLLELPVDSGVGFGMSLLGASLIVAPSGLLMMLLAPIAGRIARGIGPKVLLVMGAIALVVAYAFTLLLRTEVWHIFVANIIVGVGIGFGFAALPMLIMRSVPQNETGASNGVNALFRSVGTSSAAAAVGAVLASSSTMHDGVQTPTAQGFELAFVMGIVAAVVALALALFIPSRPSAEKHPSLPPGV